jgi:hypothetical protein
MLLPVTPCGEEGWYYPSEARLMKTSLSSEFQAFYPELNRFMEQMRRLYNYLLVIDE